MDYLQILKNKNLKATPQRIAILKSLGKHTHPNIDELYEDIKKDFPSVSLATVYKNVNTLEDENLIRKVSVPNGKSKYDIFIHPHIHIVCNSCQNVLDIPYCDELDVYQKSIEKNIRNEVASIDIVAHTNSCSMCL